MKKRNATSSVFKVKTTVLYVPNTLDSLLDHIRLRGLKITKARGERLLSLYNYVRKEKDGRVAWPRDRFLIEGSIMFYKKHNDSVLDEDIRLLRKLDLLHSAIGYQNRSLIDVLFDGFCQ
jgi:hypothetical protein